MFYLVENHYGDDNDNFIRDYVFDSPSKDTIIKYLKRRCETLHRAMIDCEEDSVMCFFYLDDEHTEDCADGNDDGECDADHRTFHTDFYVKGEFENEHIAECARSKWHGDGGRIVLDVNGNEIR